MPLLPLGCACGLAAVLMLGLYLFDLRRPNLRPLGAISLCCTGLALAQLTGALVSGLGPETNMSIAFAGAFLLMAAIGQVTTTFRQRQQGPAAGQA